MKKEDRTRITVILIILIVLVIVVILLYLNFPQINTTPSCNYNSSEKTYLKKQENCVINFLCIQGMQAFSDSCGCGCEKVSQTNNSEDKTFCTPDSRKSEVCYEIYNPVCGWFNSSIKCIKYPCAQTYSNECFACQNKNVEYWTKEECPK